MQYCRIISLDNNNSVKFTSSRGDNSTTNGSMVMKIAHAQLHMYTKLCINSRAVRAKLGEKLQTKLCPQTRTDRQPWQFQYTPLHFVLMSNFSFSHSVFYPSGELSAISFKYEIVVCNSLSIWKSPKFVVWERVNQQSSK